MNIIKLATIEEGVEELLVPEIHVCYFRKHRNVVNVVGLPLLHFAVRTPLHRELLVLHDIASERSRFIREDILNLAKLLIQIGTLNLSGNLRGLMPHALVKGDYNTLGHFHHLKRY